jgi:hypothetical protein
LHRPRDVRAIGIVSEVPQRRAIGEAAAPASASERMSNAAASESKQRHRPQAKARGRGLGVRAAPEVERRRDAKGEGIPGRGSSVSFTRCEVSRSWLDGVTRSLHRQRVRFPKSDRGVRRGSSHLRLGGKKTPVPSESRDHRSAQRRRETPSAPVHTEALTGRGSERGNRTDQGARLIRGIGQKSVVRISGSSISFASKDVYGATGGSSDDSSHAL